MTDEEDEIKTLFTLKPGQHPIIVICEANGRMITKSFKNQSEIVSILFDIIDKISEHNGWTQHIELKEGKIIIKPNPKQN